MSTLTVALPTGRLGKILIKRLEDASIVDSNLFTSRVLDIFDKSSDIRYLLVKPSDVITYVTEGVCDIGIVGKDTLLEENKDVYELLDLNEGVCDMCVAGFKETRYKQRDTLLKVGTKYPRIARQYFDSINKSIEIIKLNGSVELAPLVGLSDIIVDIVETGTTLHANGLVVLDKILNVSARLISNQVSYRFKKNNIDLIVSRLEAQNENI